MTSEQVAALHPPAGAGLPMPTLRRTEPLKNVVLHGATPISAERRLHIRQHTHATMALEPCLFSSLPAESIRAAISATRRALRLTCAASESLACTCGSKVSCCFVQAA